MKQLRILLLPLDAGILVHRGVTPALCRPNHQFTHLYGETQCGVEARLCMQFFGAIFVALSNATFVASVNKRWFHCDFCAIRVRYLLQFHRIAAKLHQVFNIFEPTAIPWRQITQKLPLVYTCDFYRELERDKNYTEKCAKSCIKNRMCKRALSLLSKETDNDRDQAPDIRRLSKLRFTVSIVS